MCAERRVLCSDCSQACQRAIGLDCCRMSQTGHGRVCASRTNLSDQDGIAGAQVWLQSASKAHIDDSPNLTMLCEPGDGWDRSRSNATAKQDYLLAAAATLPQRAKGTLRGVLWGKLAAHYGCFWLTCRNNSQTWVCLHRAE